MEPQQPPFNLPPAPQQPEHHGFKIAGHTVSKRDIILAGVAIGLLLFGIVMGALGLITSPPPKATDENTEAGKQVVDKADLINHQWAYMPGAVREKDGLKIIPRGFVIVKQDGTGGQPNPPLNLYGTYLEDVKDITLTASITPGKGIASLRLYSEPPVIADEFRDERKSIDLGVNGNVLSISTWDGAEPATSTYTFSPSENGKLTLALSRQNRILTFTVNGKQVAALPEGNVFSSGKIWFGADATTDSWVLNSLRAEGLNNNRVTIIDASKVTNKQATDSFQALATKKRAGFYMGAAVALGPLVADPEYRNVALGEFGSLTAENAMKWQFLHPSESDYDFAEADALTDIAKKNNLKLHGHTLIFGEANPPWVYALPVTTEPGKIQAEQVMINHITKVTDHFKDKVASWDVVNEPLAPYAEFTASQVYRNNKWYQAMGKEYISKAFIAAHKADPEAQLFINEFGLEEDGPRWEAFLNLVGDLKRNGVPIDGVGFQAHVYEAGDKIDVAVLRKHIQQLKSLDLKTRISEMDVYADEGPENQAAQYTAVLGACLDEPSCVSFTTWGISNRYNYFKDAQGLTQRGNDFLYNVDTKPTLAANAVRDLLSR